MQEKYRDLLVQNLKRKSHAILTLILLYCVRKLFTTWKRIKCNAMQRNKFQNQYSPYISPNDYPINKERDNT